MGTVGYEQDFYAWTREQAKLLRKAQRDRLNVPLDFGHLAEEIEALGNEQRFAVESQLERILEHLLQLEYSPAEQPRPGWRRTVRQARGEIERRLTPSIRRAVARRLSRLYERARLNAIDALTQYGEEAAAQELPERCPYTLSELLDDNWWPVRRGERPAR